MKKCRNIFIGLVVVSVFFVQFIRGLVSPIGESDLVPSGAMNEPVVVVISAMISGALAFIILEALFWAISKIWKE